MNKKELMEYLKDFPDITEIYLEADAGIGLLGGGQPGEDDSGNPIILLYFD
jgi:hypothetical protein